MSSSVLQSLASLSEQQSGENLSNSFCRNESDFEIQYTNKAFQGFNVVIIQ